jgi:hypothetical protein
VEIKTAHRSSLHEKDRIDCTYGCRHTNPDSCKKNQMEGICAFVREDNMCLSPPGSWPRLYKRLLEEEQATAASEKKTQSSKPG